MGKLPHPERLADHVHLAPPVAERRWSVVRRQYRIKCNIDRIGAPAEPADGRLVPRAEALETGALGFFSLENKLKDAG